VPVIAAGAAFTVRDLLAAQPELTSVYNMASVPEVIPVTTPVKESTVAAILKPDIDHTPLGPVSCNVIVAPTQTVDGPVMAGGKPYTENGMVAAQPVARV